MAAGDEVVIMREPHIASERVSVYIQECIRQSYVSETGLCDHDISE